MDRSGKERSTSSDACVGDETEIKAHTSHKVELSSDTFLGSN